MGNPEGFIYRNTEDERAYERTDLVLEEAHNRAVKVLENYKIKPENLSGVYSEEEIAGDNYEVRRLKEKFGEQPSKNYAELLEAVIFEHGELSEWFGPGADLIKTSDFDDIKNGVDMVVGFKQGKDNFSNLALGVDVTFGSKILSQKLEKIKKRIDKGKLGEIKYFDSELQKKVGPLELPQVVIGVEVETLREVGLLWMNRRNKELANHPIQAVILEETKRQLEAFKKYAESQGNNDIAVIYTKDLAIIRRIIANKKDITLGKLVKDRVFLGIKDELD